MKSRIARAAAIALAIAGWTLTLSAQESCTESDTPVTCFQKFNPPVDIANTIKTRPAGLFKAQTCPVDSGWTRNLSRASCRRK